MNIITADQIQQGDKIKVTQTDVGADRTVTYAYEGVAAYAERSSNGKPVWRTEGRNNLWAHESNAVIELLDRPKPKLTVPTLPNAVVKYVFKLGVMREDRFAVRDEAGKWVCYDADGGQRNQRDGDESFQAMMLRDDPNFEVLFAGVAK